VRHVHGSTGTVAELRARTLTKPPHQEVIDLLRGRSRVTPDRILTHELNAQLEQFERLAELFGCVAALRHLRS
jgi:hypothetical protein